VRPGEGSERAAASDAATESLRAVLPSCDLVVGTEEELCVAGGSADLLQALRTVRAATRALLVVKRGPLGCIAFEARFPARSRKASSTADSRRSLQRAGRRRRLHGRLPARWLRGEPVATLLPLANACGALVVSRHGCAPAMPSADELAHFLATAPTAPRLREDAMLEHIHRATNRPPSRNRSYVLAFDHRSQLEALAGREGASRIERFKALVAEALLRTVASGTAGAGAIVDDRYGSRAAAAARRARRVARAPRGKARIRAPRLRGGRNIVLALREWSAGHVAKCLVHFHPDDEAALRKTQLETIEQLAEACARTGHELLLEVIPPARADADPSPVARALEAIYASGVRPDWWKLPPSADPGAWQAIDSAIERNDPRCRGVLVLGMEAGTRRSRRGSGKPRGAGACAASPSGARSSAPPPRRGSRAAWMRPRWSTKWDALRGGDRTMETAQRSATEAQGKRMSLPRVGFIGLGLMGTAWRRTWPSRASRSS
jgi:5-dehydro-2-deoxygluconokinase